MFETFCKLPKEIISRKGLEIGDKNIFAVLANYQADNENCWPGIQRLINDTGLARSTVLDSIKRLELAGLLQVKRQGRGKSNLYITSLKSRPVQNSDRSKNLTSTSPEIRP